MIRGVHLSTWSKALIKLQNDHFAIHFYVHVHKSYLLEQIRKNFINCDANEKGKR